MTGGVVMGTYDDDGGWDSTATDVGDRKLGKSRLCKVQCDTCVFRKANGGRLKGITNARVRDLIEGARRNDAYIVCHATLGTPAPAICRGFYDRYTTNALRILGRLFGFVEIDPPAKEHR